MKKSIVSCLVLIFVLFVVSSRAIFSQEPIIYVDFPTYESINISIEPEMKISVSYPFKIDSSCLNPLGAMYESNWDSTYNRYIVTPIDIIFSDYYDGNDSTLDIAKMMGSSCSSILINDTVFKCIPNRFLEYETEYGISFDDLRVYNSITGDTLVLDTIISPLFTTTQPMYSVKNISSNGNSIRTGDTITVEFNRELQSASTVLGPICSISTLDTVTIDDTLRYYFAEIPSHSWLGPGMKSILIMPDTNYTIGKDYFLNTNLHWLTGDSAYQMLSRFYIKEKAMINTMVRSLDSTDSLPIFFCPKMNTKTYFLDAGEELVLEVSKYDSNYFFVGWECPDYINIDGHTETSVTLNFEPAELQDLDITAVFAKIHQDTIKLHNVTGGGFSAFTPGATINDSVYTLPRKEVDKMLVIANPAPQYVFSHWVSNNPLLDGSMEQYLEISPLNYICSLDTLGNWNDAPDFADTLYPRFDYDSTVCTSAAICVTVELEDGSDIFTDSRSIETNTRVRDLIEYVKVDTIDVDLEGEGQLANGCYPIYNPSIPVSATVYFKLNDIYAEKYEIAYYYDIDNKFNIKKGRKFPDYQNGDTLFGRSADPYGDSVGTEFSEPVVLDVPDRCVLNLKVVIYRRRCYLSTEMLMADTSYLPYPNVLNISFNGTHPGSIANTNLGDNRRNPELWAVYDTSFLQTTYFKKVTWYKIVPYGDTVYLQDQLLLTDRGFEKGTWYGEDGYVNTPIIDNSLVLIMNSNVKTLYLPWYDFRLVTIGYEDPNSATCVIWDVTNGWPDDCSRVVSMSELTNRNPYSSLTHDANHEDDPNYVFKTAQIILRFSRNVDENSLTDQNMNDDKFPFEFVHEGLYGYDLNPGMGTLDNDLPVCYPIFPRFDGQPLKNYFYDSQTCSTNGNLVYMKMVSPNGFGLPHMSSFILHVGSNIRSEYRDVFYPDGIPLSEGSIGEAQFGTEYPTLEVKFTKLKESSLGGDCNYIIVTLAAELKNEKYVKENPTYSISINNLHGTRIPIVNCFTEFYPDLQDEFIPDFLNYHLYKEGFWSFSFFSTCTNDCSVNTTNFFNEAKQELLNKDIKLLSKWDKSTETIYNVLLDLLNNTNWKEKIRGHSNLGHQGEERYAMDGNWGILAFPGKNNLLEKYAYRDDNNNFDKYRFLYLWRTYMQECMEHYYKIRLY